MEMGLRDVPGKKYMLFMDCKIKNKKKYKLIKLKHAEFDGD